MAESILKLKVESSEYDTKLKKAAEGIRHLAEVAHRGGGELTGLEKSELDYIKALGDMETKSRSAAGQMRELSNTYRELKVVYDQLNEVEKADEGGKALAASLDKLRQRAIDAKDGLDQAAQSLQPMKQEGSSTSSMLEQLAGKFTINIDALKLLNFGLQGTEKALEVARDAFFASEANFDEWGRIIASSEAIYEGFLTSLNNGDFSGYLDHIDEIVQAARTAYDELDRLGTMRTIQGPQYSKQEAENTRMRTMLMTGTWISAADGRKSPLGLKDGDKLTPEMMKTIERQLKNGVNTLVGLTKNELGQTGRAIDAYYNSLAKQNGMSLSEFRRGTSNWSEFEKRQQGYANYQKWRSENYYTDNWGNLRVKEGNPYQQYAKWGTFRVDKMGENSYNDLVGLIRQQQQQTSQMYSTMGQAYRTINRVDGTTVRGIMGGGGSAGSGGRSGGTSPQEKAAERMRAAQDKYAVALEKAQAEFDGGNITEKDLKTAQRRAAESLFEAADDAYRTYADPQYKTVREDAKQKFVNLGGEVKTLTEIEKANQKTARELEAAQKKLTESERKMAEALQRGNLGDYLKAQKEVVANKANVDRLQQLPTANAIATQRTITVQVDSKDALKQLMAVNGAKVDPKSVKVTADTEDATEKLADIEDTELDQKDVTVTVDTTESLEKLTDIEDTELDQKDVTVTVDTTESLEKLTDINDIELDTKNVIVTITDDNVISELEKINGIQIKDKSFTVNFPFTESNLNAFIESLKERLSNAGVGLKVDDSALKSFTEQVDQKLGTSPIPFQFALNQENVAAVIENLRAKLREADFGSELWKDILNKIGDATILQQYIQNSEQQGIDQRTGKKRKKDGDSPMDKASKALGGLNSIAGGLEKMGVELPSEVQNLIGVIEGAMAIIQGVQAIIAVTQTTALTANTIALGALTAAMWANVATGFIPFLKTGGVAHAAQGFVPGNNYSDNVPLMVSSGELILNRAQQGNLASQLEGGAGLGDLNLSAVIRGEQIRLVLNNNGRRTGRGEYVQSKSVK